MVKPAAEFQAIILAGYGQRLYHLVDETPKPLLPIANNPMIFNVLHWLESSGITNIFLVSTPESGPSLSHYLSKIYETQQPGCRIELIVPEAYGTADALRAVSDKIKSDVIVLSCDLLTDTPLTQLLNFYRLHDPSILCLFANAPKFESTTSSNSPSSRENLYVCLDRSNQKLLMVDTIDFSDDERYSHINIHMPILENYGTVNIYSNLHDSHVYIMKKWLLEWIATRKEVSSIREDLLPLLVKAQHSNVLRKELGLDKYFPDIHKFHAQDDPLSSALQMMNITIPFTQSPTPARSSTSPAPTSQIVSPASSNQHHKRQDLKCSAFVIMGNDLTSATNSNYCIRTNTVPALFEMNKYIAKSIVINVASTAEIPPNSQVGTDCLVGDGTKIGERSSVKKSVIGSHCIIGKYAKIVNCLIMDYVVIDENVKLEGCIICNGANIKAKSFLRDCEIGSKYIIEGGTNAKGEQFIESRVISADEDGF